MKKSNKISAEVFLFTGEWSDYSGKNILKFIGTSEELGAVEILITNNKPVFFVEKSYVINPLIKNLFKKRNQTKKL